MKIKTVYQNEDETYTVSVGEQVITVPCKLVARLISCLQVALYRQKCAVAEAKTREKGKASRKA